MRRLVAIALASAALTACQSRPPKAASQVTLQEIEAPATPDERTALARTAFGDVRLRARLASLGLGEEGGAALLPAVLDEGEDEVVLEDGALDLFAFAARERLLASAATGLRDKASTTLEGALVRRLVSQEKARVEDERKLGPRAALLLWTTVEFWQPPPDDASRDRADANLSERLVRVRKALSARSWTLAERDGLDDALDPLEHLAMNAGLPRTLQEIAHLRVRLGELTTKEAAPSREVFLDGLESYVGVLPGVGPGELLAHLETVYKKIGVVLDGYEEAAPPKDNVAVADAAAAALRHPEPCPRSAPASSVRSAGPPPERAEAQALLCRIARASSPLSMHVALLAAHDVAASAVWAGHVFLEGTPPYRAENAARLRGAFSAEEASQRLRRVVLDPVPYVAAALALGILLEDGAAHAQERARRWLSFGDAPFDVALAQVFTKSASSPPRAAPRP